jgi:hypothetical protein
MAPNGNGSQSGRMPLNGLSGARPRVRFGEAAVKAGFVKPQALEKALDTQKTRDTRGESHKLLGIILLEMGAISNEQLIDVLKQMNGTTASGRIRAVT